MLLLLHWYWASVHVCQSCAHYSTSPNLPIRGFPWPYWPFQYVVWTVSHPLETPQVEFPWAVSVPAESLSQMGEENKISKVCTN